MTEARDLAWYRLLLGWLEANLRRVNATRMGIRNKALKLVAFPDSPGPGRTTWATFEESDRRWQGPDVAVGYELVFTSRADLDGISVIARAVEVLRALERPAQAGQVLVDLLVGIPGFSADLRHAILVPPWLWDGFEPLVDGRVRVEPVAVVPVSEAELDLARREGIETLTEAWERAMIDVLEPGRLSAV